MYNILIKETTAPWTELINFNLLKSNCVAVFIKSTSVVRCFNLYEDESMSRAVVTSDTHSSSNLGKEPLQNFTTCIFYAPLIWKYQIYRYYISHIF